MHKFVLLLVVLLVVAGGAEAASVRRNMAGDNMVMFRDKRGAQVRCKRSCYHACGKDCHNSRVCLVGGCGGPTDFLK
jgi:hypothetical protein